MKLLFKHIIGKIWNFIKCPFKSTFNLREKKVTLQLVESIKRINSCGRILINVPIEKCVTGVYWKLDDRNPFIRTILENDPLLLKEFYKSFQPQNVNDLLGLKLKNGFGSKKAFYYILPWFRLSPEKMYKHREEIIHKENTRNGENRLTMSLGGHSDFGPVSDRKLKVEEKRLFDLYQSIKSNGYVEDLINDGGIRGYFLVNSNKDWRFYITAGKHRSYVLAGLGYNFIPVVVDSKNTIYLEELNTWNQVKANYFSPNEARFVFNNFFK